MRPFPTFRAVTALAVAGAGCALVVVTAPTAGAACNDVDVEYHDLNVSQPYDKALVKLLSRR